MAQDRRAADIIKEHVVAWRLKSDEEVLTALAALPVLADEDDPCWTAEYWNAVAYPYLALADVAGERRLRAAIPLLLERACFGDPGEIMRGLRNTLEAIVAPEWDVLADACLAAAASERAGARMWALDELAVLDDPRAKPLFEAALQDKSSDVRMVAEIGLERLAKQKT